MKEQNYKNHIRFYPVHHFIFYPVLILLTGFSIYKHFSDKHEGLLWLFIAIIFLMIGWLSFMLRQHYALGNQNRIVRLEIRFRYYLLTNERFEKLEDRISFGQMAALRFASDEELPLLVKQTLEGNLSPDEIKRLIKNWQGDYMRL